MLVLYTKRSRMLLKHNSSFTRRFNIQQNRERQRQTMCRGHLLNFEVGDHVLSARVRRPGSTPKLVSTWVDPWRVVTADKVHVEEV